jgi:hypothetical protein
MSTVTQPKTLVRAYFSAVATGTEAVVGLDGYYLTTAGYTIPGYAYQDLTPVQWEIKNDSTTDILRVRFGFDAMVPAAGTYMNNWINLLPGQAYTQQKRLQVQELNLALLPVDLIAMRVKTSGASVAFSGTLDAWFVFDA